MDFEKNLRPGEEVIYQSKHLRVTREPEGGQQVGMCQVPHLSDTLSH